MRIHVGGHDRGVGPTLELDVAGDVVAVAVRVRDDELVALPRMLGQPVGQDAVHGVTQREELRIGGRARVEQQGPVVAEE